MFKIIRAQRSMEIKPSSLPSVVFLLWGCFPSKHPLLYTTLCPSGMCMLQFQTVGAVLGDWVFNVVANFNKTSSSTTALGEEGVCRETEGSYTWGGSHAQQQELRQVLGEKALATPSPVIG